MNFIEAIDEIETQRFSIALDVVSGLTQLINALERTPEYLVIKNTFENTFDVNLPLREAYLRVSILDIASREIDIQYGNPWDIALLTLVHCYNKFIGIDCEALCGCSIMKEVKNTFYLRRYIKEVVFYAP